MTPQNNATASLCEDAREVIPAYAAGIADADDGALHEALRLVLLEGLEKRFRRHEENHLTLKQGLRELGLGLASQEGHQLWQLNAVDVPSGADEAALRKRLLVEHNIEVGAGLGALKGKIIRVGLMGETSKRENVARFLTALRAVAAL